MSVDVLLVIEGIGSVSAHRSLSKKRDAGFGYGLAYGRDGIDKLRRKLRLKSFDRWFSTADRDALLAKYLRARSAQRKREIQHEMEEARSWYSADQALPEFEAMLEYLVGREAQCRSWFGDGPGSYDFVVWDLRNVVASGMRLATTEGSCSKPLDA